MDVLAVLPTGYGKSIIYQILPKVISELRYNHTVDRKTATVIVVSPLEQIRKQQVERLNTRGIKSASLDDVKASDDTTLCEFEVFFGSAEQWLSDKWVRNLKYGYVNETEVLVVDEVHTIQTWRSGKKGKAAFRRALGHVNDLRSLLGNIPVLGLTATADKYMRQKLCKLLNLKEHKEILISPNRQNLQLQMLIRIFHALTG
ncbi:ATP-dependent DNA helicase -like [Paramuricea clavata]|uniref:DNA 3'-5' helicase n=1 Tax=Paramuricea clavata TaxID=317549 RepID=A0A7D9HIJ6_PARCT|nr:ATP-dependent DNA helicase -like [Paramuricea clavata]